MAEPQHTPENLEHGYLEYLRMRRERKTDPKIVASMNADQMRVTLRDVIGRPTQDSLRWTEAPAPPDRRGMMAALSTWCSRVCARRGRRA